MRSVISSENLFQFGWLRRKARCVIETAIALIFDNCVRGGYLCRYIDGLFLDHPWFYENANFNGNLSNQDVRASGAN